MKNIITILISSNMLLTLTSTQASELDCTIFRRSLRIVEKRSLDDLKQTPTPSQQQPLTKKRRKPHQEDSKKGSPYFAEASVFAHASPDNQRSRGRPTLLSTIEEEQQEEPSDEMLARVFIDKNSALRCLAKQVAHDETKNIRIRAAALQEFYKSFDNPWYTITNPFSWTILYNLGLLDPLTGKVSPVTRQALQNIKRG